MTATPWGCGPSQREFSANLLQGTPSSVKPSSLALAEASLKIVKCRHGEPARPRQTSSFLNPLLQSTPSSASGRCSAQSYRCSATNPQMDVPMHTKQFQCNSMRLSHTSDTVRQQYAKHVSTFPFLYTRPQHTTTRRLLPRSSCGRFACARWRPRTATPGRCGSVPYNKDNQRSCSLLHSPVRVR